MNHVIANHKLMIYLSDFSASAALKYLVWFLCLVESPKQTPLISLGSTYQSYAQPARFKENTLDAPADVPL